MKPGLSRLCRLMCGKPPALCCDFLLLSGSAAITRRSLSLFIHVRERQSLSAHQAAEPLPELKLQNTCIVDIQRFAITKNGDDNSQTNRSLCSGYGHHDKDE